MREHTRGRRTRKQRPFEIDLVVPGLGAATGKTDRFRCSAETRDPGVCAERRRMIHDLGQRLLHDVLAARLDGRFTTEQLALAYKQGSQALRALLDASQATPLAALRDRWMVVCNAGSKWEYQRQLNAFIAYCGGEQSATVADLTAERIIAWLSSLVDNRRGRSGARQHSDSAEAIADRKRRSKRRQSLPPRALSEATRNRHRTAISAFCKFLVNTVGVLTVHPLREGRVPKRHEADSRMPQMTARQWDAYLAALKADVLAPAGSAIVAKILRHTAADVGEVVGYERRVDGVHVPGFLVKDIHANRELPYLEFKRQKVAKSPRRMVPYVKEHVAELLTYISDRGLLSTDPVFADLDREAFERAHKRARKVAGCPDLRLKDFRHLAAISWAQAGVRLERMCSWMGHSSIRQTEVYARFGPHDQLDGPCAQRAVEMAEGRESRVTPSVRVPLSLPPAATHGRSQEAGRRRAPPPRNRRRHSSLPDPRSTFGAEREKEETYLINPTRKS